MPWTEKRTNVSILQQFGNVDENWLLNTAVQRKLAYFGHVKRHDSLERTIYEGIIEGKRGRGRPKEGGVKTSLIVSTPPSPRPEGERRIGLHTEELSKTQRAYAIRHQDDDDDLQKNTRCFALFQNLLFRFLVLKKLLYENYSLKKRLLRKKSI